MRSFWVIFISILVLNACSEKGKIVDDMKTIPNNAWSYDDVPDFVINVKNPQLYHNFYVKLRIQKNYPYENLYLLAHIRDLNGKISSQRVNLTLADESGLPFGNVSGNTINYELPLFKNIKMSTGAGAYFIALEQNMRDSVINGIENIGIKVIEGDPVF